MKNSILAAVIAICSITAYAQPAIGVQLGANFGMGQSGGSYFASGLSNDPKVGLVIGLLADIPVIEKLSFRPELNFIQKGSKYGGAAYLGGFSNVTKVTLNYIELPLNVVYKMSLGSINNKLYFGLVPFLWKISPPV